MAVRAGRGYRPGWVCSCEAETPEFTGTPTFAPIDYILGSDPIEFPLKPEDLVFPPPLVEDSIKYPWWAIDDVGLDRFVGKMEVTELDLQLTATQYPNEVVKTLALAFLDLMHDHMLLNVGKSQPNQQNWCGLPLYDRLDTSLESNGSSIQQVLDGLVVVDLSDEPWFSGGGALRNWPVNFMPRIKYKLLVEMIYQSSWQVL